MFLIGGCFVGISIVQVFQSSKLKKWNRPTRNSVLTGGLTVHRTVILLSSVIYIQAIKISLPAD